MEKIKESVKKLPEKPGVYLFKNDAGQVLYVGKAINLRKRVKSYFQSNLRLGTKTRSLVENISQINHLVVESEFEALLLEAELIKKYQPKYNSRLKDDRGFLYIKITDDEIPRVYATRKIEGGYGPFPKAGTVRQILKLVRPIFPYCSCPRKIRTHCLYHDLDLCPGPSSPEFDLVAYKKNISLLKRLLTGKSHQLLKELTQKMNQLAKNEEFEKAAEVRDQIERLEYLNQSRHPVAEYLENANFVADIREEEGRELHAVLNQHLKLKGPTFVKIEAYDISNISGQNATGSMVVFLNGEPDKSQYRKFRIRSLNTPNDTLMMKEILRRRLKHPEWEYPDLIVVDGGKGQVNAALEEVNHGQVKIPVIGLAKRLETVIVPLDQGNKGVILFKAMNLGQHSPALNLLKRIRDEAHRFAISYHQKLRRLV